MSISLTYTEAGEVAEQSTAPSSAAEVGGGSQESLGEDNDHEQRLKG